MKTINVTDEQYDFLIALKKELETQNNRITANPVFCVYAKDGVIVNEEFESYDYESFGGGWSDGEVARGREALIKFFSDKEQILNMFDISEERYDETDKEDVYDICNVLDLNRICIKETDTTVGGQYYFTLKGAEDHIHGNHYHYNKPFVYVESAWRNIEFQTIRDIILGIMQE